MSRSKISQVIVGNNVLLDGRLALFHKRERWLAVADLHFGYELSQRAAGNLFPLWGMQTVQERLEALLRDYKPAHLILLGDIVHNGAAAQALAGLLTHLQQLSEIVLISGNHDRELGRDVELVQSWRSRGFCFHHGDCAVEDRGEIQIIGHHHPAGIVRDGAGLRLKLPAFVQRRNCWILPAFSPWAAGVEWPGDEQSRIWLCSPQRILRVEDET
jgi:DNA ligase-associated metallophosphoesterase